MLLSHCFEGSVCILRISGDFTERNTREAYTFLETVFLEKKVQCLIVNLSENTFIDSSGVGWHLATFKRMKEQNVHFAICGFKPREHRQFNLTHADRMFKIYETEDEALKMITP